MKKNTYLITFATVSIVLIFFISCNSIKQQDEISNLKSEKIVYSAKAFPKFAKGFKVDYFDNYKLIKIYNPRDTTQVLNTYILTDKNNFVADSIKGKRIFIPLNSFACLHSTQIGYANRLGVLDAICGVSEAQYIKNQYIHKKVKQGEILEFGSPLNINHEKLLSINPDILLLAPHPGNNFEKLEEIGINLVINTSFLETTPLARAEWIKFLSCFFNKEDYANQVFDSIVNKYQKLKELCKSKKDQADIFTSKKYGQIWYLPGGESYMSKFFEDAGVNYLWKNKKTYEALALDFETVYAKAASAEFWCIKDYFDGEYSYNQLAMEFEPYSDFKAFKDTNIIFCNTFKNSYFEDGIMEPDIVLADLIKATHPELLTDYKPKYFKRLLKWK
ncbi:MAG: ABC transporter substrate-binding protein [Bacteroidales bacterium]|nr:ABC transporter substrate-binding protein [Bacteroidales bacterium]